ncbi:MAG: bacterial Ig-like domain-containing protein, partial [Salinivirgaceae bacterium]|nr:bacterial Ig-like domain-containing protein [Salinivirgaceae bacterium]
MKRLHKIWTIIVFVVTPAIGAIAQPHEYRFTFEVSSRAQLDSLSQMISIDRVDGRQVWAYANPQEMVLFRQTGISYTLFPDKNAAKDTHPMATTVAQMQNIDRYPTYEVYDSLMHNYVRDYPLLCQLEVVTTLASGRQILALKISNNVELNNTDKPEVLCTATMHGDEGICATTALSLCRHLLSNYGTDNKVSRLLDSIEFWVIPIMNPDGMYRGGNSSIDNSTRSNGNGKDLNRNYPDVDGGSGTNQPEIVGMIEFFYRHHFSLSTNLHGGDVCFNYPWDTWERLTADDDWWRYVGGAYRDTTRSYGQSGFWLTNGYAWYSVSGGQQDWANYFAHCREVTIELCNSKEPTSTSTIANVWKYHKNSLLNFYAESLNGVRGTVTNAAGTPLAARITIEGHDIDNSWIETDARVGDYHRYLKAGTYNLTFEAEGYAPQTVAATVVDGQPTWLNVTLYKLNVSSTDIMAKLPSESRTTQKIVVSNCSESSAEYSIGTYNADWLSFDHIGGNINAGKTDTLTAIFNSRGLDDGSYHSIVEFKSVSETITVKFTLNVNNTPVAVELLSPPNKLDYTVGEELDLSGSQVSLRFCNDSVAIIGLTDDMVTGFNSQTAGFRQLMANIFGYTISFNVVVRDSVIVKPEPVEIEKVEILSLPEKLKYLEGDTLDVSGGVIVATYTNGTTDTIAMQNSMIGGFSSNKPGTVLLTVKYGNFANVFGIVVEKKQ